MIPSQPLRKPPRPVSEESAVPTLKRFLLGKPIPSHLAHHERLSRITGLAVLSSDALSSVAYATDFIVATLALAGAQALGYALPISFVIATLLALAFLIGVITSSTAVSIMGTCCTFFFAAMLVGHERFEALVSSEWKARLIKTMYWIFPKTAELGRAVVAYVAGDRMPAQFRETSPMLYLSTAAFGIGCLVLASWFFQRKEF